MADKAYNYYVNMEAVGERIRTIRKQRNISMKSMEDFFGISAQSLYKWERGASLPEIQNLVALSKFFGVSIDSLLIGPGTTAA